MLGARLAPRAGGSDRRDLLHDKRCRRCPCRGHWCRGCVNSRADAKRALFQPAEEQQDGSYGTWPRDGCRQIWRRRCQRRDPQSAAGKRAGTGKKDDRPEGGVAVRRHGGEGNPFREHPASVGPSGETPRRGPSPPTAAKGGGTCIGGRWQQQQQQQCGLHRVGGLELRRAIGRGLVGHELRSQPRRV